MELNFAAWWEWYKVQFVIGGVTFLAFMVFYIPFVILRKAGRGR